ncbi:MAG: thioredoxin domain-containing protein [Minisyncoccia bacterium]
MNNTTNWFIGILVLALIIWVIIAQRGSNKYDDFAKCIANPEKGVTFFGAFWCPHCQTQKKRFGSSERHLPYVECSTQDGRSQLQVCKDAGITTYPTWEFATSSIATSTYRIVGEIELTDLAERTLCQLPQ